MGLDAERPRFSWKVFSDNDKVMQSAYRIVVEGMWDSGKVISDQSVNIEYNGKALKPFTRYVYTVKVWDNYGNDSGEANGFFETGSMTPGNFKANWITTREEDADIYPVFRKEFNVEKKVKYARIYATALGLYEMYLNGERVGDEWLAPGFTSYNKNLQYQTYDIQLQDKNTITVVMAKGWCRGDLGWNRKRNIYSAQYGLFAEIRIFYEDGSVDVIGTDDTWKYRESPFVFSEIYDGEIYDAAKEDYFNASIDDGSWDLALTLDYPKNHITAQVQEPIKIIDELKPVSIIHSPKGETIIDFGQNMVGWVQFTVQGQKNDRVSLSHAEVLDVDGNFYTDNLRSAKNQVTYILKGNGIETYHPHFTFQGFRYVRVDEFPEAVTLDRFKGLVIHSDLMVTGEFESSNSDLNQLFSNIMWGQKGNFVDIPTDCPQRDERLGWTGDAQVFVKTAAMNMNVAAFFTTWLKDLAFDQNEDGSVPDLIPKAVETKKISSGWGDAAIICPWEIYNAYADERILENQYESMKKWVEYIRCQGENEFLWNTGNHYGDWLGLDATEGSYKGATSEELIATAYYAYSSDLLSRIAGVLGHTTDQKTYRNLFLNIKREFNKVFITQDGRLTDNTQTAYTLALHFNLVDDKRTYADYLAKLVADNNYRIATGFIGTPYILHVLSENGHEEIAVQLLLTSDYPSWLYAVKMGATTIWEHWDGIKPDGSFWSSKMNSFNHYAYGAVADWMYTKLAGINFMKPGYKEVMIKPLITRSLEWVRAKIDTMHGVVSSYWEHQGDKTHFEVIIPSNVKGVFVFPDGKNVELGSGTHNLVY